MKFLEDPRVKIARRGLLVAWLYYAVYLLFYMGLSYTLSIKPYLLGLPRWVTVGNIIIPFVFVVMLIFVAEKFIPDVPLTDKGREEEDD